MFLQKIFCILLIISVSGAVDSTFANTNQNTSQQDTQNTNQQAAQQAMMMGTMAIGAGTGMIAAGMAQKPPNGALIAAGAALVAAGIAGIMAAQKMAKNAGVAGSNSGNMNSLNPSPGAYYGGLGSKDPTGIANENGLPLAGPGNQIKVDPSFLKNDPRAAAIFADLQKKAGMSIDDLMNGLGRGKTVGDMLAGANKGVSAAKIDSAIAQAKPMSNVGVMNKLGLTPGELEALAKKAQENTYAIGEGGGRSTSANKNEGFGNLFGANEPKSDMLSDLKADLKVSPDIKAALEKKDGSSMSIFEMVNRRYKVKSFELFGIEKKALDPTKENPFDVR